MEINEMDFRKLQSDVTEIKDALLGTKYTGDGLIKRVHVIECDHRATGEIIGEVIRWKSEAQKWKDQVSAQLSDYEKLKWKLTGILLAISFIIPFIVDFIKRKIGI